LNRETQPIAHRPSLWSGPVVFCFTNHVSAVMRGQMYDRDAQAPLQAGSQSHRIGGLVVPRRRAVETRRHDKSDATAVGYASSCLTNRLHQSDEGNQCDRGPCHFGHQSGVGDQMWSNFRLTAPAPLLVGSHSHQKLGPSGPQTTSRGDTQAGQKRRDRGGVRVQMSNKEAPPIRRRQPV